MLSLLLLDECVRLSSAYVYRVHINETVSSNLDSSKYADL